MLVRVACRMEPKFSKGCMSTFIVGFHLYGILKYILIILEATLIVTHYVVLFLFYYTNS